MGNKNEQEIHIGSGHFINIRASQVLKLKEHFIVYTQDGPVTLDVEVSADFANIDPKYHEIFYNVLTSKYMNKASFGENPFSECRPIVKRKWWQFWKAKYFELN
jgi:hypothetical protein